MEHATTNDGLPGPQPGLDGPPQHRYPPWWGSGSAPATPVAHYWLAVLGALAAFILLLNFYQVVRGAVQQGEVQRLAWEQRRPVQPAYAASGGAVRNEVMVASMGATRSRVTVARWVQTRTEPE